MCAFYFNILIISYITFFNTKIFFTTLFFNVLFCTHLIFCCFFLFLFVLVCFRFFMGVFLGARLLKNGCFLQKKVESLLYFILIHYIFVCIHSK